MKTRYQRLSPKPLRVVAGCFLVPIALVSLQASSNAALPRSSLFTPTPSPTALGVTGQQPSHTPLSPVDLSPTPVMPLTVKPVPSGETSLLVNPGCSSGDIDAYLGSKGSPLAGTGATHVAAGQYYNVDPRLVVAIAGAESTFGRNGSCALYRHNAWGYGGGWPNCWNFNTWDEGIWQVTWQLWDYIYRRGLTNIHAIGQLWCGSGCTHWEPNVRTFYAEQGGNPDTNDLSYNGACGGTDTTPPDGEITSPSENATITSRTVRLEGWASDSQSGLNHAHFTAYYNGSWRQIGADFTSSPFGFDWDMCDAGVPNGQVTLGLDIWDNAGNAAYSPRGVRHFTKSYDCGCTDVVPVGAGSSRQQLFVDVYNRNGGRDNLGCTENGAHWWGSGGNAVVIQDFTGQGGFGDCAIIHDEQRDNPTNSVPAYVVHGAIWVTYRDMGGPDSWLGPPTSDEFNNGSNAQSNFRSGYITWSGNNWQGYPWPSSFSEWKAEYFNLVNQRVIAGYPTFIRNESSIDHDWGNSAPDNGRIGVWSDFAVRWTRNVNFSGGRYRFHTYTDDGVRLWVGNTLVIDDWNDHGATERTGDIDLNGTYAVKMEYYDSGGSAVAKLWWERLTLPPNAPSNLSATAVSASQINLSWRDNSGNETGFKLYRNGSYLTSVGANVTSYQDTGLNCGTSYSYYVKAYNAAGESGASNTATATTQPCGPPITVDSVSVDWCQPAGMAVQEVSADPRAVPSFKEMQAQAAAQSGGTFQVGRWICRGIAATNHTDSPISTYWSWTTYNSSGEKIQWLSYNDWPWTMNPGWSGAGWKSFIPYDLPPGLYTFVGSIRYGSSKASKSVPFSIVGVYHIDLGDFDGDGRADPAVWKFNRFFWLRSNSNYQRTSVWLGWSDAVPVTADYDGDGKVDPAVWRTSTNRFVVKRSRFGYQQWEKWLGWPGAIPAPADYDGDGKADPAVWWSNRFYYLSSKSNYQQTSIWLGWPDAIPVPADYDSDGKADPAVWRTSTNRFVVRRSRFGYQQWEKWLGWPGAIPVPADYDGDGKADPAVWKFRRFYWLRSNSNYQRTSIWLGWSDAVPQPAYYDSDRKADPAVWRTSTNRFVVKKSRFNYQQWDKWLGWAGAIPVTY